MGEPSINLQPWQLKQHFACFECRKAFKAGGEFVLDANGERVRRVVSCPNCGRPMAPMGRQFRAPRQAAVEAWVWLAELVTASLDPPFEQARAGRRRPAGARTVATSARGVRRKTPNQTLQPTTGARRFRAGRSEFSPRRG